jgi:hypothetical protein
MEEYRPIQVWRGTAANMPILADGELGWTTDTHVLYIGDGKTNHPVMMSLSAEESKK